MDEIVTVGHRIAQKRKELSLSQEALGEKVGVSRQAIYKWESDASLPEIEKLVALSRIFNVSVGWLLGVEEDRAEPKQSSDEPKRDDGELTDRQITMVKEIVDRYVAASKPVEPKSQPQPKKRGCLGKILLAAAVVVIGGTLINLFSRLDQVQSQYNGLSNSINYLSNSVNSQIGSITNRVEEILKSQNELTANWSTSVKNVDFKANTITFNVQAVPKTYVEGMTAVFMAQTEHETFEADAALTEGGEMKAFSGEITCELTDNIVLSVVFITGDQRSTQFLDQYTEQLRLSYPDVWLDANLWIDERDGVIPKGSWATVSDERFDEEGLHRAEIREVRVGLFRDQELVVWYVPGTHIVNDYDSGEKRVENHFEAPEDIVLDPGYVYSLAAVITDEAGREFIAQDLPIECDSDGDWEPVNSYSFFSYKDGWIY